MGAKHERTIPDMKFLMQVLLAAASAAFLLIAPASAEPRKNLVFTETDFVDWESNEIVYINRIYRILLAEQSCEPGNWVCKVGLEVVYLQTKAFTVWCGHLKRPFIKTDGEAVCH